MAAKNRLVLPILLATLAILAACSGNKASSQEKVVTVQVTVPVLETRMVLQTREVERAVVVTATPVPTPVYSSRVNAPSGTLLYPLAAEPANLDPQEATDEAARLIAQQLYESLFRFDRDGAPVPAAASRYEVSPDSKNYTITLRSGLMWSDGQPVTAREYVDGFCRGLDPAIANPDAVLLGSTAHISGAEAYASGQDPDCAHVGVRATDTTTLQIRLARPIGHLPALLASAPIMPSHEITTTAQSQQSNGRLTITNGAYTLAEWVPGSRVVLAKNQRYWNAPAVGFERIEFRLAPGAAEQLKLYTQGELSVADLSPDLAARVMAQPGISNELHTIARPGTSYLSLNTRSGPTADVNFRRAIASAIDRTALLRTLPDQPWHAAATGIVPPGLVGYPYGNLVYPYNPEAVKQFLAAAGYGPGKAVPVIDIWGNSEGSNPALLQTIAGMLEQAGIPVRLVTSTWGTYIHSLEACKQEASESPAGCNFTMYRMGWMLEYADPASILQTFAAESTQPYPVWQSDTYQKTLSAAMAEPNPQKAAQAYAQAEKILLTEAAVVPLQYYDKTTLIKAGIRFSYPPAGAPNLQDWGAP